MLRRAICSVLAQTYSRFQVLVYDNASGDETPDVVAEIANYNSRVKYHCHPENIGVLQNFQSALRQIETPYFSILSDDDVLLPDFYSLSLRVFQAKPDIMFTIGITLQMDQFGNVLGANTLQLTPGYYAPPHGLVAMVDHQAPAWTGMLFRREILERVGYLDLHIPSADLDFELRAAGICPFAVCHEPMAIFCSHTESSSFHMRHTTIWPSWLKIIENLNSDERIPSHIRQYAHHAITTRLQDLLFKIGLQAIALGDQQEAKKVAEILRCHFDLETKSQFLLTCLWLSRRSPYVARMITRLYHLRTKSRMRRSRHLQEQFGQYRSYLALPDNIA